MKLFRKCNTVHATVINIVRFVIVFRDSVTFIVENKMCLQKSKDFKAFTKCRHLDLRFYILIISKICIVLDKYRLNHILWLQVSTICHINLLSAKAAK